MYDKSTRRLVGVAGADLTLFEVDEDIGCSAREKVTELSASARDCANVKALESCELQALRSQTDSRVADILSAQTCYRFGDSVYYKGIDAQSWDDAQGACEGLGGNARLAVVDSV